MQCKIELPEPTLVYEHKPTGLKLYHYTAEQVRAAILAEREANALKCEGLKVAAASYFEINERLDEAAAAIRRGSV